MPPLFSVLKIWKGAFEISGVWILPKKAEFDAYGKGYFMLLQKKKILSHSRKLQATNVNWTLDNH